MKRLTIIIGLMCLMGMVQGQAVTTLTTDTIALGDQTTLCISHTDSFPSTDMLTQGSIVALSQTFDTAKREQRTILTCFEPGEHYLHIGDDSLLIVVNDVEVDTSSIEIRDIAPLQKVPYTFWEIFRWILLALGIVAIGLGVWWILTHHKKMEEMLGMSEPVDTRTPAQRALDNLETLRRQQLWQTGKVKEYHTLLTDAVRQFIEESTGIRATEMTSDETIEAVESGQWRTESSLLRNIFSTADLVKFAKSEPLPYEHDRSMNDAIAFINQLWEKVKPAEPENKEADHE